MKNAQYPRLNSEGLALLKQWIEDKACHDEAGSLHSVDANNLNAWANEAEESALNGNLAIVEMQSINTRSGLTETLTLPRHCIEWIDMD